MTKITLRVKELRELRSLTQAQLAKAAHISPVTINRIERGLVKGIDFLTLEKLAKALGVDPALLIVSK
jgi:transcriptional regulator with XRE-family HTH domain